MRLACKAAVLLLVAALLAVGSHCQPFEPGQGLVPLGNLRTKDKGGPYNLTLLDVQANEVRGAQIAKGDYTDRDIIDFLVNVECLEGQFDTWGAFGHGFFNNLSLGGPEPHGVRKAHLSKDVRPFVEEIALSEQGHALFTRQAGSLAPCPVIDIEGGFNKFLAAAYELKEGETVLMKFGAPFDPFKNDVNFLIAMLTLEENGATGNKGLAGLLANPVLSTSVAGLATAATGFAAVERMLLWPRRREIVHPFNETVLEVFARISALRDRLDGPPITDQGLVNTDPRFINVPDQHINMIPTDVRGLTFNRAPQQLINILTLGDPDGKGCFFPEGFSGRINKPAGFDKMADGYEEFPFPVSVTEEARTMDVGEIPPPITPEHNPPFVPGEDQLTQDLENVHTVDERPDWRGIQQAARGMDRSSESKDSSTMLLEALLAGGGGDFDVMSEGNRGGIF